MSDKRKFEESMTRLEKIVDELEKGEFSLEESIKKFEEGLKLGKSCKKILDEAESKVKKLVENEGGELGEEDVDDEF